MKKKLFGVILTLCMILSLFSSNSLTTNAADKTIATAVIETVPSMSIGTSIADAKADFLDVPKGCNITCYWQTWDASLNDGNGGWKEINNGTFAEDVLYKYVLTFQADEGYSFHENGFELSYVNDIKLNGPWGEEDDNGNTTYFYETPVLSSAIPIYDVVIKTPEVAAGNTATLEDIVFYFGDQIIPNDNFDIETKWFCETQNYEEVTGKPFENGHSYSLQLHLKPHAGYYFFNELNILHNSNEGELSYDVNPFQYDFYYNKSLLAPLEQVELTGLPKVKVGETMSSNLNTITNLDDLDCTISVEWWDENGNDTTGQIMESGHTYTMQIEIYASGNTTLSKDFSFVVDGTTYKATKIDEYNKQPLQAWLSLEYKLSGEAGAGDYDDDSTNDVDDVDTKDTTDVTDKENNTSAPKTGDTSMIMIWMVLALASAGTIVFVRKRQ